MEADRFAAVMLRFCALGGGAARAGEAAARARGARPHLIGGSAAGYCFCVAMKRNGYTAP
jgi:hypothetical protein